MKFSVKKLAVILLMFAIMLTGCSKSGGDAVDTDSDGYTESESLLESGDDTESADAESGDTDTDAEETEEENTESAEDAEPIDLSEYTIIRGYDESSDVLAVISEFYFTLMDTHGLELDFYVDEDVKPTGKEIVFGDTDRRADKNHRYSDYSIELEDGNIYICGGSAPAVKAAVEWMLANCMTEGGFAAEKLPYEYNATYELDNLKVCGVAIGDFGYDSDSKELTEEIRSWVGPRAGIRKISDGGYVIKVVEDPTLYLDEVSIKLVGKELILASSSHLGDPTVVVDYFMSALKSCTGNELSFFESQRITLATPTKPLTDVRQATGTISVTAKAQGSYKVGDEMIVVCSLTAGGKAVSCPKFVWKAESADGKTYSGEVDGTYGKTVIKLPATEAGRMLLKVLVKDENGELISCVDQAEGFDKNPVFSIIVGAYSGGSMYMKEIPECFETTPIVYAVDDSYQIMVPVLKETLMWVEVDGQFFYDEANGVLRSNTTTHRMTVPQSLLDEAGEYTVYYRIVNDRRPYNSNVSKVYTYKSSFKPVTGDNPRFFMIADAHNRVDEPVAAAKAYGEIDFLILNGDIPNDAGDVKNFSTIHRIAAEVTNGEIPVVFARGNHDMRGKYAENLAEHTPTDNGNSYFTFRLGSVWGMVLDCGEDKPDNHAEYGGTISCEVFRQRQTEFINSVIANAENEYAAEGVEYVMVISHDPFTEYEENKVSAVDYATYNEWARLLREYVKPDVMISGHVHRAYITQVGDELDRLGQPCPVVVGSAPGTSGTPSTDKLLVSGVYIGTGIECKDGKILVEFIGDNGITYRSTVIENGKQ